MIGNERMNDASSVPSSPRSRAAAVTSIRAFARIELRIVAPLRSASRRRIQTPSPRRRHRTTVVEIVSFYHTTTHFSHPSASSLTPPLSSLLSPLSSRARTRASPVAPPPPPLSPPPPSPLSSPTPPPASVSATSETVLETPLAPPRPRPPRSPRRARVPRDTSLERARGTRAPTTAPTRASERRCERTRFDRPTRPIERPIDRPIDRAGRWRPCRAHWAPIGRGRSDPNPNPIAGLDDAETTKATPRSGTWVCEVETRSRGRTGW